MYLNFKYNTNVLKLLLIFFIISNCKQKQVVQDDPITQELQKEKQEYIGANLKENEAEELKQIEEKYAITAKEKELRSKQMSGQELGLIDRFRLGRANRKDYMRNKKFEEFKRKKVLNSQSEKTRTRMQENWKKTDTKYKKHKHKQKRKSFFNLFK